VGFGRFEVNSVLEQATLLEEELNWGSTEAIGNGEHDVLYLRPELVEVDFVVVVSVESIKDRVVKGVELSRGAADFQAHFGLHQGKALQGFPEAQSGTGPRHCSRPAPRTSHPLFG